MALTKVDISLMDNTGTTANKLLAYDGSGNLPAVDGSQLTNVATGITESSSDPTISTNPSGGVGTQWNNTTSGEVYICTDATAGANVWTNVGAGSGDISLTFQGESYGYRAGGGNPASNVVDRVSFTSDGNATDIGDLTVARMWTAGAIDFTTYGYIMSGGTPVADKTIDRFAFAGTFSCTDVGDIQQVHATHASASSPQGYGYYSGGTNTTYIDKVQLQASANSTDAGDLTAPREENGGTSSDTYGYVVGGYASGHSNIIEKFTFSSDNNATDVGDLATAVGGAGGTSASTTHGYLALGGSGINTIQKWTFATDANGTDVGDASYSGYHAGGASATSYGYVWGGRNPYKNDISKYSFTTDGNGTDVGDLTQSVGYTTAGLQN